MSFNPLVWKSFDLSNPKQEQLFMGQLTDLLNFLNSAQGLSTLLNGSTLLGASALTFVQAYLSNITTNQTVNCSQAASISGFVGVSAAFSPLITFTNMTSGTPFSFRCTNGFTSTINLKFAATDPLGNSYAISAFPSGSSAFNMTTTGVNIPTGQHAMFSGCSFTTNLDLLLNVT